MTDLVCGEVLSVPTHVAGRRTKKGVVTIRKLTLRMCCKNRCSNTCRAGATAVVTIILHYYYNIHQISTQHSQQ